MTQTGLDLFAPTKELWLNAARDTAHKLLKTKAYVTIEDVIDVCPRPIEIHRNTTGAVFKTDDFTFYGWEQSRRTQSRGRWIMQWQLKQQTREKMKGEK